MSQEQNQLVPVAKDEEIVEGKPKAVRVQGRSVALFRHKGQLYATDNQCPHMGYPLTRGRVRNGVLTCDWHGWSYDMRGGGCFTGGCDDLDTYPVEVRGDEVFIDVSQGGSKREDAHFLLLKDGLLSGDNWTLSKAIAIMLARGVSESQTLDLLVEHMGRFIATEREADGGRDLALLVNGIKVARLYQPEDRLIPLMMAASGAAGRAGDRPQVEPLPEPITWEKLERWIRLFSADKMPEGIEKCLVIARNKGGFDERIVPLLYQCAVQGYFLGQADTLLHLGYLAEVLEEFGWEKAEELVCNLAGKMLGRGRPAPQEARLEAMQLFDQLQEGLDSGSDEGAFDEEALAAGLVSGDLQETFGAVAQALRQGGDIDQIATVMVLLAGDRMARTPVNMSPGWGDLSWEMNLAAAVRSARRYGGDAIAARALLHTAWQFYEDRWLNISPRPLGEVGRSEVSDANGEDEALERVLEGIETIQIRDIGRLTREYLNAGYDGDRLLLELGQTILKDDNGWNLLHTLRTVSQEWQQCQGHPARGQLLVGLARWATDVRRNTGNNSAVQTAQRFARGETAVELYE
ncbi:MAG: Rieske 2Fe-2S domain-containing protein [Candidatus Latescibacteria bacterium]|nr:Rieske 2Fe-2S domain-containing protein [Candidatus Latescibacterota bacterium]